MMRVTAVLVAALLSLAPGLVAAQEGPGPLRIEITEGVIEPLPVALPSFAAEGPDSAEVAGDVIDVIAADLSGTGLFRIIPREAHVSRITSFESPVRYDDWQAINAQALVTGNVITDASGRLTVQFRLFDVFTQQSLGEGLQFTGTTEAWRRMAHRVADQVYSRITGEAGYFDSRVAFVDVTGPREARRNRLAIMDYDGANVRFLTDATSIVLTPRFAPDGRRLLYTSYEGGVPRIYVLDLADVTRRPLVDEAGLTSFAPRFSPDGGRIVYSIERGGNTDLYILDVGSGQNTRLTEAPSIETAPSFSPDGSRIVFESDRSGSPQLYIMPAAGGPATRLSAGAGRYSTPVWSPNGDYIAFTNQNEGRWHIGVMRADGSEERLLTSSFLDEGPTWAPNGRVIMFTRETPGGAPSLYSVDILGRNLQRVPTPNAANDPAWSPLQG